MPQKSGIRVKKPSLKPKWSSTKDGRKNYLFQTLTPSPHSPAPLQTPALKCITKA